MEKHSGSWLHQQHLHPILPNLNLLGFPSDTGHLTTGPHPVEASTLGSIPLVRVAGLQQPKASEPNNSKNWFHYMPRFSQSFAPVLNSTPKENFLANPFVFGQHISPGTVTPPSQKSFLVFDQSGDRTTLMYSSGVQTPVQCGTYWAPKPNSTYNLSKQEQRDRAYPFSPLMNDENVQDYSRNVTEDEMHEDSEELNALLYSDSEYEFSEDDEETSTGHSPSAMTNNCINDLVEETGEEVDSFALPTKRQKLVNGNSLKTFTCSGLEDDAESSCGKSSNQRTEELRRKNMSSREKIRETVNILQRIIPGANGKGTGVVIDEAILYLRSLKVQAKALGLKTL